MYPKQLLRLVGKQTMLQETALRLSGKLNYAPHTMVVCNAAHRFLVAEQLREADIAAQIVLEPEGRNTAPAAALAAVIAMRDVATAESPPLLLVMPADHVIEDRQAFLEALAIGEIAAADGRLVTFGIVPTSPHTGYGYIEIDERSAAAVPIKSFVEKPDEKTATAMLRTNRFLWNSGIFLFRADSYLEELSKFEPDMVAACQESISSSKVDTDFTWPDAEAFRSCPANSIDYAVMERTDNAAVVPLDAGWSDVGSWAALHDVSKQDENGNTILGDVVTHNCRGSYISATSRLVATVGLEDVIVVEDKDSVLVARKDRSEDVKAVVDKLKQESRPETGLHRQVFRPWGSYDSIDSDEFFQAKRLIVSPGAVLSLQSHKRRAEHWVVVRGTATITLNDDEFELGVNESTYIPVGAVHRIANKSNEPVHIIEVQCGDYFGEDDIVRYEDNYGREGTNT
jgi:mannose-1-phosphate guanylyltransferase/mannose-6-phosphate isomerase